uniref:Lipocalin/cytosolic fatty-acid binding domain-containing protein n=1 Tax=Strigamia maritima TaxID=126957 RepID=T1IHB5_STRMM
MLRWTLFVFLPFLAYAHHNHDPESGSLPQDGPCSNPPAAQEKFQINELTGRWYAARSNYDSDKDRQCVEIKIEQDGNDILGTCYFKTETSNNTKVEEKYSPIADQPGRYNSYLRATPGGDYVPCNLTFTIVKVEGDNALEYACKEEGNQHIDFYRSYSRKLPVSEDADNQFIQIVKDN